MRGAWRLALRNLARNRRRNLATGVAIALGYAGLLLIGGYAVRIEHFLRTNTVYLQHTGHLSIYKEGGLERAAARPARYGLSGEEQERIRAVLAREQGVERVGRYLTGMGLAGNGCRSLPFQGLGVEPETERWLLTHPEVLSASPELARPLKGRDLGQAGDVAGAVGLSAGLANLLSKSRVHDEVSSPAAGGVLDCAREDAAALLGADANVQLAGLAYDGSLSAVDGEVVSLFHTPLAETEDSTLVAHLDTLQSLYGTDAVTYLAVYLKDWRRASALAPRLEQALRAEGLKVSVYPFEDERVGAYYVGTRDMLGSLVGFIGLLVSAVVALSVLNAMTLTLLERTRELGTFRALGFTRGQLLGLLVRESVLLSVTSLAAGLALGLGVSFAINVANVRFSPPGVPGTMQLLFTPTPLLCAGAAAALVALSAVATYAAGRRRTRQEVVELLTAVVA